SRAEGDRSGAPPLMSSDGCFLVADGRSGIVVVDRALWRALSPRPAGRGGGERKPRAPVRSAQGGNMKALIATMSACVLLCLSGAAQAERASASRSHGMRHILLG